MRTDWVLPVRGLYPGEDIASYTETTTRRLSTWAWHWFRQVTGPCNVACGSGIMTVNLPSGNTLQCDTWLWDDMPLNSPGEWWQHHAVWQSHSSGIMTLNSPGRITLQCDTTLGSWHWNGQVAAPCNVAGGSGMITWNSYNTSAILNIWFRFWPYHCSQHVILHQSAKFYPNRTTLSRN